MIGVDASVAAKWIFTEEHYEQARALLRAALSTAERIVAPPLLRIEVTNIIRQRMRQEALPLPEARQRLAAFLAVPVTLRAPRALYRRALEIARQHDLPAAYDAHYVALAERLRCVLWTDDQRLLRARPSTKPSPGPSVTCPLPVSLMWSRSSGLARRIWPRK